MQDLSIDDFKSKPPDCSCSSSPFNYSPIGHVITGDINIVNNAKLRNILAKGPKFREPQPINWKYNFKILMDAVEDYARQWAKREKEEVESLSEWIQSIRSLILSRINHLRGAMSTNTSSIFEDPEVKKTTSFLHDKYVIVPADKAPNNIVFVCKRHYIDCLMNELGMNNTHGNQTYSPITIPKEDILENHKSVLSSFGICVNDDNCELPSIYWIPKLHKCPYKQRFIAGSAKCSTASFKTLDLYSQCSQRWASDVL